MMNRRPINLVGDIVEVTKPKIKFDEGFQMEVGTIEKKAELRQKVRFKGSGAQTISGEIEYQVCDDVVCLPPKGVPFSFEVQIGSGASATDEGVLKRIQTKRGPRTGNRDR